MSDEIEISREKLFKIQEALKGAYTEIDAMTSTYEEYVPSGRLCDQIEEAITMLNEALW